jgi:hypothetical protein
VRTSAAHSVDECAGGSAVSGEVYVTIMRHGERLDEAMSFDDITDADWADRWKRPHDTPLSADNRVGNTAARLRQSHLCPIDCILTSP